jgi:hypothetical protein
VDCIYRKSEVIKSEKGMVIFMKFKMLKKYKEKRFFSALLALTLTLGAAVAALVFAPSAAVQSAAAPDGSITMVFTIDKNVYTINGAMSVMDVSPTIIEERTLLPVRFVSEPLGAAVGWEEATSKVTVQLMDTKLELWIGQSNALVNGVTTAIDPANPNVKPLTINDRTMLPIRFVTENLGCDVEWVNATQQVVITKKAGGAGGTAGGGDGTGSPSTDATPTPAAEATPTPAADVTPTPAADVTPTHAPEATPTPAADVTPTPAPEATPSPVTPATPTPMAIGTPTPTPIPAITLTTPTPAITLTTPTPTPTATPRIPRPRTPSPTPTPTRIPQIPRP